VIINGFYCERLEKYTSVIEIIKMIPRREHASHSSSLSSPSQQHDEIYRWWAIQRIVLL